MGNAQSKKHIHEDFQYWDYNQFAIRIETPALDRLILVGTNEALWHEWDTRFDVWMIPTQEAARHYIEISDLLKSTPCHVLDFHKNKETARIATCAQGVDRWRQVAKLLTVEIPKMPLPWDEPRSSHMERGVLFKNLFGTSNKGWLERRARSSDTCAEVTMTVWYRFERNQKVDNFVKAAGRELLN